MAYSKTLGLIVTLVFALVPLAHADWAKEAEKLGRRLGCASAGLVSGGGVAGVSVALTCAYGTEVARDGVGSLIDSYFEGKDQEFANANCVTIVNADGSKIEPQNKKRCKEK